MPGLDFRTGDALILVDPQNDFCPGGALPIEGGDQVVEKLNRWIDAAVASGTPVFASRDWHPEGHLSFKPQGGPWPPHCLQDSEGAAFHPRLRLPDDVIKVTKGVRFDQDQNSAFDQTGLAEELRRRGISRIWLSGLAQDVCVAATALDARREGFEVLLIAEGTRPVTPEGGRESLERMREAGVRVVADA
jgi:nicotinamidase/pyrazinamidase